MPKSGYIGLMSGTSADGVDACLAEFPGGSARLVGHVSHPFDTDLRRAILRVVDGASLSEASELDVRLADTYVTAVSRLLEATGRDRESIRAIGCHGQTVLHRPEGPSPTSIQLGDPHRLAVHAGIDVVADFRRADLAAGGQGAPLAPAFHAAVFGSPRETRAVINIGGMSNMTVIPAGSRHITGFDTGPGNALLDGWIERHHGQRFDRHGEWATRGRIDAGLLESLLSDAYFARNPPKSTGREYFHLQWLDRALAGVDAVAPEDVQATLTELTAVTIARAVRDHASAARRVLICGGGARNTQLMQRLAAHLGDRRLASTQTLGIAPEHVEAMAFAWLAQRRIRGLAGNRPEVTGAARSLVLGSLVRAPR